MPLIRREKNSTEVRQTTSWSKKMTQKTKYDFPPPPQQVSRLYAHSKNYDMDLTLDYNVELFPLLVEQSFALALASSLSRGPVTASGDDGESERNIWRQ